MRRVVITGMGIIGPLGNNLDDTSAALRAMRSGIVAMLEYAQYKFGSQVAGVPVPPTAEQLARIPRSALKNMTGGALYNLVATLDALAMAGLSLEYLRHPEIGAIMGTGTGNTADIQTAANRVAEQATQVGRTKPATMFAGSTTVVARTMASTNSANHQWLGLQGPSYTISSACASAAIAIGEAAWQILAGRAQVMLAGGGDGLDWQQSSMFDGMPALARNFNAAPHRASRAFDQDRCGFVIAGGGATLVLEELEHAKARGATILAELVGYGQTTDGSDSMTEPMTDGPVRAMRQALKGFHNLLFRPSEVDYINPHGTSTPVGDLNEIKAIEAVFGSELRASISSTKSLTGHSLGTAGAHEAIYCILMMLGRFMTGSANLDTLDPLIAAIPASQKIITATREDCGVDRVLSNSFGFGGTNAALIFQRYHG